MLVVLVRAYFVFSLIRYVNGSRKCLSTISNLKTLLIKTTVFNITYRCSWLTDFTHWREVKSFRSHYKPRQFNVLRFASYFRF